MVAVAVAVGVGSNASRVTITGSHRAQGLYIGKGNGKCFGRPGPARPGCIFFLSGKRAVLSAILRQQLLV